AGDLILKEAGSRIEAVVGETGTAARFGGDEFVILIPKSSDLHSVLRTTHRMLASLRAPFSIEGESLRLTASAGVALYPRDGDAPENLLQNASLAMERAKKEGGDSYRLFSETLDRKVQQRIRLEGDLRNAIDEEAFFIHYQPKISMIQGKTLSVEALLRWTNRENESIPPDVFIPLAEDIGEINSLGRFVLERSCLQAKEWRGEGRDIVMCVNVSAKQLASERFVHSVLGALERTGTPARTLELEITESAFMSNPEYATRVMEELKERGLRFTLDDFGTGYSSLSYIRSLPLSGIKIDRSFTADLDNPKTRAIVSTIMHMAGELNLELTVEGIETTAELNTIRSLAPRGGDILLQGYLFSRPIPPDTFSSLFDRDFM
ncbi:MAG: bifunctional diguanylate cyclase/phosphodiesterase, partial [Synergistaceae bacterium]|nr:bifunctional diguanylate cyclase/phosphodiesterase [Synergistaceae bacterium]